MPQNFFIVSISTDCSLKYVCYCYVYSHCIQKQHTSFRGGCFLNLTLQEEGGHWFCKTTLQHQTCYNNCFAMIIIFPYERQNCCELFSEFVFEIFPSLDSNPCVVLSECPITTDLPLYSPPWGGWIFSWKELILLFLLAMPSVVGPSWVPILAGLFLHFFLSFFYFTIFFPVYPTEYSETLTLFCSDAISLTCWLALGNWH